MMKIGERELELLTADLRAGRLTRREALVRLTGLGLSAGGIASVLAAAVPRPSWAAAPGARGASGVLKMLYWQAPTILNPHLTGSNQDLQAARLCLEPLLTVDVAGAFTPVLAAAVPTRANGGLSADGRSVTYKLKRGIRWADGQPFSAQDVIFTWRFITNKQTGATWYASYDGIETVEAPDPSTVKITFKAPTPAWFLPFVGDKGLVLPQHVMESYLGESARRAPFNMKCFGTGPYKVDDFAPGDHVLYSINELYREPTKPAFGQVQLKGGGDATSAARAVLETGEYDFAFNLQVEWPVLEQMASAGKGVVQTVQGGGIEAVYCNMTDPNKEIDGQRSSIMAPHPFLTDVRVRQALGLAIDRETVAKQLYGEEGGATANALTTPTRYASKNTRLIFDIAKANQLLDEAGWQRGPDGVRVKGGMRLHLTYVTSVNTLRQKEQEIVKAGWEKIGVAVDLKAIESSVFFSTTLNNDTFLHFYSDVEMYTQNFSLFPSLYMAQFFSGDPAKTIPQKDNNWSGQDVTRWQNEEYNTLYQQAQVELDPKKNDALWIKMNDLVVGQAVELPIIDRRTVAAHARTLDTGRNLSPFDNATPNVADWRRTS
ncbi:MAG TPA: peptide ABC transporter substrate-binding protein [bacterium]|nr:peptide ABC transporter substrate-binding protein [bacterium]